MTSRRRLTWSSVRSRTRVSALTFDWARIFCAVGRPMPKMYVSATSTRFSRGMSTPAIRAIAPYPCRCLCFGLVQMTTTVPWRRMILQLSQRALTDALTFNGSSTTCVWCLLQSVGDAAAGQVVGRKLDPDSVARQDPDEVHPKLAGDVGQHPVAILQLDREHGVRKGFDNGPLHFDRVSLGHRRRCFPFSCRMSARGADTRTRSVSEPALIRQPLDPGSCTIRPS